jgi:hypothetical protein
LRRSRSRSEGSKSEGGSADRDLCFQDQDSPMRSLLRSAAAPASRSKATRSTSSRRARTRACIRVNDSREWGVALA